MSFMIKVNKVIDFMAKFGIIIIAFLLALLPVAFLFGNEILHHQDWYDDLNKHSSRAE